MSFVPNISPKVAILIGIGTLGAAYLYYEYRSKRAEEQILEYELAKLQSPDIYAQRDAIEKVLERVSNNKKLLALMYDNPNKNGLQQLNTLITSRDPDVQYAAIEIVGLMSEDEKRLDVIRDAGLFQALLSVLSSPVSASDEVVEVILIALRNCTKPTMRILQNPETGQLIKVPADEVPRDRNDDVYDRDDEWFTKELYQLHGLEAIVAKLQSEDEDIQDLALEIITNYCKLWKNKEEVGELGGLGYITKILASATTIELQSRALIALRHCVNKCDSNVAQLRKTKPISAFLAFLQTQGAGAGEATQTDLCTAIYLITLVVDGEGAAQIRKDNLIPQLIEYAQSSNEELMQLSYILLQLISKLDNGCKQEFVLRMRNAGNSGMTPRRTKN